MCCLWTDGVVLLLAFGVPQPILSMPGLVVPHRFSFANRVFSEQTERLTTANQSHKSHNKLITSDLPGSRTSPCVFERNGHRGILGAGNRLGLRLVTTETVMVLPRPVSGSGV